MRAAPEAPAGGVVAALGLSVGRPVIVVNGGADEPSTDTAAWLPTAMSEVATAAVERAATLVTGATDVGVFALLGAALGRVGADYVCLGVAPAALTTWPGKPDDGAAAASVVPLEAHHTHFVAVEAARWGDEMPLMMGLASRCGAGMPSVAVLAGGGAVAAREVRAHLDVERPVIVLEGSGRLADRLAGIVRGTQAVTRELAGIAARRDLLEVCDPAGEPSALGTLVRRRLDGE